MLNVNNIPSSYYLVLFCVENPTEIGKFKVEFSCLMRAFSPPPPPPPQKKETTTLNYMIPYTQHNWCGNKVDFTALSRSH